MKSELSFLMDLFLSDEVPLPIKKLVSDRIREVEGALQAPVYRPAVAQSQPLMPAVPGMAQQAPSMQRIMQANPDIAASSQPIVTSPIAAAALQHRQSLIQDAISDKPASGRTSPRKF